MQGFFLNKKIILCRALFFGRDEDYDDFDENQDGDLTILFFFLAASRALSYPSPHPSIFFPSAVLILTEFVVCFP